MESGRVGECDKQDGKRIGTKSTRYVVHILLVAYTLNYLDRQIANIVAEPIKIALHLSDSQLGLLTGLAFALFYSLMGLPLAQLADRPSTNRPILIAVSLGAWSVLTALCGLAANFPQLVLTRMGVGIGEAGGTPASHSLISDLVPREGRASALGIYSLGIPFGKLFGLLLGGIVAQMLGWRAAFIIIGLPGTLLALVLWATLPEPRKYISQNTLAKEKAAPPNAIYHALGDLFKIPSFWMISFGGAFMSFLSYGQTAFLGSFLIRTQHVSVGEAGILLGLALGGGGAAGAWLGGTAADHLGRRDVRAYVYVPVVCNLAGGLLFALLLQATSLPFQIILLGIATALTSAWYGPCFATVQNLVPSARRGMAAAVNLLLLNLIGLGLGPLSVGILSDLANHGFHVGSMIVAGVGVAEGLRHALMIGAGITIVASAFFLLANRSLTRDLKRQIDREAESDIEPR